MMRAYTAARDCSNLLAPPLDYRYAAGSKLTCQWDPRWGISLSSGNVTGWADILQNVTLTAPAIPQRPVFGQSAAGANFNGLSVPKFDGSNDSLQIVGGSTIQNVPRPGWLVVYRMTAALGGSQQNIMSSLDSPVTSTFPQMLRSPPNGDKQVVLYSPQAAQQVATPLLGTTVHCGEGFIDASGKVVSSLDGTDAALGSAGIVVNLALKTIYLANDRGGLFAPIEIGLVLLFNEALTAAERVAVRAMTKRDLNY
jgi:hypothetical protein